MNNNEFQEVDMNSNMDSQQPLDSNQRIDSYNQQQNNDYNQQNDQSLSNYNQNINDSYQQNVSDINYNSDFQNDNYTQSDGFSGSEKKSLWQVIKKPFLIILAIIIVVVLIILIIKGCGSKNNNNDNTVVDAKYKSDYNILSNATENYFTKYPDKEPSAYGECNTITLGDLTDEGLITSGISDKINTCDEKLTTIKACKLDSGKLQYVVNFSCTDSDLAISYKDWSQGSESNLSYDSDVRFTFLGQETVTTDEIKAGQEEIWKDEITYPESSYTVIGTQIFYRYRTATWKWTSTDRHYYPSDTTNANNATSYYVSSPSADYKEKGDAATVYKWYVSSHEKYSEYTSTQPNATYSVKGAEGTPVVRAQVTKPDEKSYRTIESGKTIYSTRPVTSTLSLTKTEFQCAKSDGTTISSENSCSSNTSGYTTLKGYKCYYNNSTTPINGVQTTQCAAKEYEYGNWGDWTTTKCTAATGSNPVTCQSSTGYVYTDKVWEWFTPSTTTYYPSGSTKESEENTYYKDSPVANAIRDDATATTAYKWYKNVTTTYDSSANPPTINAVKTDQGWTGWSEYSLTKPAASTTKQIEEREKITLSRNASSGGVSKNDITDGYVSLDEMLEAFKNKGYEVNSLDDILANPAIVYKVRLFYRNVK